MAKEEKRKNEVVMYQAKTGAIEFRGDFVKGTIWANRTQMAAVFGVNPQAISKHLQNIYNEKELTRVATSSKMELVQNESGRLVKRVVDLYNLDAIIAVGYRINSIMGTKFRIWATKVLRQHVTKGYTINPAIVKRNFSKFQKAIENIRHLLPPSAKIDNASVLELVSAFADTWLSLHAYDVGELPKKGVTKKTVTVTAERLAVVLAVFKSTLAKKGGASDLFGVERTQGNIAGIVGNVMQSFGGKPVYATVEEKAAHLLYFIIKNHPLVDGNKRSAAYAFVWFLNEAKALRGSNITPATLTAITLFIAESDPKHKDRMIGLVLQLLKK